MTVRLASKVAAMIHDEMDTERRKPVWAGLSELWLDTELTHDDLVRIAEVMKRCGDAVSQLRDTYLFEVAPVVCPNLLVVAGEWAGFDEEWLSNEAAKRARMRSLVLRAFVRLGVGKWLMTSATERHWDTLIKDDGFKRLTSVSASGAKRLCLARPPFCAHKESDLVCGLIYEVLQEGTARETWCDWMAG